MIPLFTAILVACSGPAPERCVDIDLGAYGTSACAVPAQPLAAAWLVDKPQFRLRRLECRQGSASA